MALAVKRWQRSGASMRTRTSVRAGGPASFKTIFGARRRAPALARQHRARRGEGGAHAHLRVVRAADHRELLGAGGDAAEEEAVAVALAELTLDRLDLADHHPAHIGGEWRHGGDLDPRVCQ